MSETLKNIIDKHRRRLLPTPNIQVLEKELSDERIQFRSGLVVDPILIVSIFSRSNLTNMEFIHVCFELSYFETCIFENCIFENTSFKIAELYNCVFKNCRFINCNLNEIEVTETIFNECKFLRSSLYNASFKWCKFQKTSFEDTNVGSAVLIDSKFSNSTKSIEFDRKVYFNHIFEQINQLDID